MTKEGGNVKNWKKRFFVVRYDYKIDYYDKEEVRVYCINSHCCQTFKAGGNPKGTINPCGYEVEPDPSSFLAKKAEQLAEKLREFHVY